tara:strand:- start:238 stop:696 length:459 start_codon:yes stop_codon:yes gene_type:complete
MRLKELKTMIAEEYGRYLREQEDVAVDVQPDVDVDAMPDDMGDEMGEDAEATLRTIYDMLSDYFEGGEEEMGDVEGGEEPMDDVEGEEAPEADLEEWNGKNDKKATTTKSGQFGAAGYKKFSKSSGHTGFGDKGGSLNEVKRMQKLANIIKG